MKDMIVRLLLRGDNSRMDATLRQSESRLKSFGSTARREFASIRGAAQSLQSKLAALGMSVGAVMLIKQSAELDRSLTSIGQTADIDRVKVMGLRKELFRMSKETGQGVEGISLSFNKAVQAGLKLEAALAVTDAVNKASAVSKAPGEVLTPSLTTAAAIFDYDLAKPGQALLLLDKMRVAGKLGNAEMENLANIFPRVGFGAKRAGMSFEQTLAFVEGLSQAETIPEKLATLSSSWLRLFTNNTYMQKVTKSTGIKFFDKKGARRDALEVFTDIKQKHDLLKTDAEKHSFISKFLEGADTETITASIAFLGGNFLEKAKGFSKEINEGAGIINRELPDAINNAVDQTDRLKASLREAADAFVQPFNEGIAEGIKKLLDKKEEGGLDMSGKELVSAGATALGVGYLGYKLTGEPLKKLIGRLGSTGAGIAEGKAIEYATGVTPVFVTNWPGTMDSLNPSSSDARKRAEDLFKKPGISSKLPFLAAGGMLVGITTAIGGGSYLYLNQGGPDAYAKAKPLISAAGPAGMFAQGIFDFTALLSGYFDKFENPEVKNDIKLSVTVDQVGRVITKSSDPNTRLSVDLNRGTWDNPLGAR